MEAWQPAPGGVDLLPPYQEALSAARQSREWLLANCNQDLEQALSSKNILLVEGKWNQIQAACRVLCLLRPSGSF
jgi:hypothetical protein